jgi:hypothetical protein
LLKRRFAAAANEASTTVPGRMADAAAPPDPWLRQNCDFLYKPYTQIYIYQVAKNVKLVQVKLTKLLHHVLDILHVYATI